MAKFFSRLFRSNSASSSHQTSFQDSQSRSFSSNNLRNSSSFESFSSYRIASKELDKHKLHRAAWEGNFEKVKRLARTLQINSKDPQSRTPLHLAVVKGHIDIIEFLVHQGAKLDAVDGDNRTPLLKAVVSGNRNLQRNYEICRILVNDRAGNSINAVDNLGKNALHYAIDFDNINLVDLFLSNDKCNPNILDREQMSPLHLAVKRNSTKIVELLLSNKYDQTTDPNIINRLGQTALHVAASVGYINIVRILLSPDIIEPCDPMIVDNQQLTAYELAVSKHEDACAKLIEEYMNQWIKRSPRRRTSTSLHEQASTRITSTISLKPATNLDYSRDDTSDDSSTISTKQQIKAQQVQRTKRTSDQWSDENSVNGHLENKTMFNLFKANPILPEQPKSDASDSIVSNLINKNPLKMDAQHRPSKGQVTTSQKPQNGSFFGIGPVVERIDSDNTSTTVSAEKMSNKLITGTRQNHEGGVQSLPSTKSWSDDTITLPKPKTLETTRKKSESDSWDTSTSEHNAYPSEAKSSKTNLQKTQPFMPTKLNQTNSDSEANSVDTEIFTSNVKKPMNKTTGYQVIGIQNVQSPLSDESSWPSTSATPAKSSHIKAVENLAQLIHQDKNDESSWTSMSIGNKQKVFGPTEVKKVVQETQQDVDDELSWSTTSTPAKKASTSNGVQNLAQKLHQDKDDESSWTSATKGIENLVRPIQQYKNDDFSWSTTSMPFEKPSTSKGVQKFHQDKDEESSWTSASNFANQKVPTTNGTHNLPDREKTDNSLWDDSRPLSASLKESKQSNVSPKLTHRLDSSIGIENLSKITNTIIPLESPKLSGKIAVSSFPQSKETLSSESSSDEIDDDSTAKKHESLVKSLNGHSSKFIGPYPNLPSNYDKNNAYGPTLSMKSSFNDIQFNELKEDIKRIERNQEDTRELKRQLREMEMKKNDLEKTCQDKNQLLTDIESKLQQEKHDKERLEWSMKNLNGELSNIKQRLYVLEDEKESLNEYCKKLKEESENHDRKLQTIETNSFRDEDIDKIAGRRREEMKLLQAENEELHQRTKQLESNLQLHKESLERTVLYKIDLEKVIQEKTYFQQELDRLKNERKLIEQEKLEYKTKYDSLQDEIRKILFDRSKLEQKLTSELHEHIQEKQQSLDDIQKHQIEIEQLNIKLSDAEARLRILQNQNESLLLSKDRSIKNEFESVTQRLEKVELDQLNAEQRYHTQTNQTMTQENLQNNTSKHSTPFRQQSIISSSIQYSTNEHLREALLRQHMATNTSPPHQFENMTVAHENYLIENSKQARSETERVKSELDRLRQDFDKLVAAYEPKNIYRQQTHVHSQIDLFRKIYENEFQQRKAFMSKLTNGFTPTRVNSSYRRMSSSNNDHSHVDSLNYKTFNKTNVIKERLETAIDTSLADQRCKTLKQMSELPRLASSLLTINTATNGAIVPSTELLRKRYHV